MRIIEKELADFAKELIDMTEILTDVTLHYANGKKKKISKYKIKLSETNLGIAVRDGLLGYMNREDLIK